MKKYMTMPGIYLSDMHLTSMHHIYVRLYSYARGTSFWYTSYNSWQIKPTMILNYMLLSLCIIYMKKQMTMPGIYLFDMHLTSMHHIYVRLYSYARGTSFWYTSYKSWQIILNYDLKLHIIIFVQRVYERIYAYARDISCCYAYYKDVKCSSADTRRNGIKMTINTVKHASLSAVSSTPAGSVHLLRHPEHIMSCAHKHRRTTRTTPS
jgi:hypothetical protein